MLPMGSRGHTCPSTPPSSAHLHLALVHAACMSVHVCSSPVFASWRSGRRLIANITDGISHVSVSQCARDIYLAEAHIDYLRVELEKCALELSRVSVGKCEMHLAGGTIDCSTVEARALTFAVGMPCMMGSSRPPMQMPRRHSARGRGTWIARGSSGKDSGLRSSRPGRTCASGSSGKHPLG